MAKTADYGLGPYTFPRGWFMIADATALESGRTVPLRFFGRDFVLYRGKDSGKPVLLDGVTVDFSETPTQSGLSFINPNAASCGCSTADTAGPPAQATVSLASIKRR